MDSGSSCQMMLPYKWPIIGFVVVIELYSTQNFHYCKIYPDNAVNSINTYNITFVAYLLLHQAPSC